MDTTQTVFRSAKSFFAGTLLSRVSGLFRDIAMAISFGSSPEIAAFIVSYRLANLFRRLLGEGNLGAAFIPHYTGLKERGAHFYRDVVYSMALILLFTIVLIEAILWGVSLVIGSSWLEIVYLTMWMVPGLFFICLYALNSSLLQCHKKYFIPAVAPVAFNLIWISAVLLKADVYFLAVMITLAFGGQWFVTIFEGIRLLNWKEWLKPRLFSADFKRLIKPLLLGIVGVGAVQFNSAFDTIFARFAELKGPAFLWYAIRIQQLPLALFGIALTGALLPPLSRATDNEKRRQLTIAALKHGASLMLICTFGIFALSEVGINLLFGHGDFSLGDVKETSYCLWAYGAGLVPSVFVLILAANCYSQKNYRLPTVASLVSVGVNLGLNALFVFGLGWGAVSVAIATTASSIVNCVMLSRGGFNASFWGQFGRMALACSSSTIGVMVVDFFWIRPLSSGLGMQISQLSILMLLYFSGVCAFSWKQGLKELLGQITDRNSASMKRESSTPSNID